MANSIENLVFLPKTLCYKQSGSSSSCLSFVDLVSEALTAQGLTTIIDNLQATSVTTNTEQTITAKKIHTGEVEFRGVRNNVSNVGIGQGTLVNNRTLFNTAIGWKAGNALVGTDGTAGENTYIGTYAGLNNTNYLNTAVGTGAMLLSTNSYGNVAIGWQVGQSSQTSNSVLIGWEAAQSVTGQKNIVIGSGAGRGLTSGTYNTFIGTDVTSGITTGSNNVIIGSRVSGLSAALSNNIILADGQGNRRINVHSTGNVTINTIIDSGFRFDVNGTSRISNKLTVGTSTSLANGSFAASGLLEIVSASTSPFRITPAPDRTIIEGNTVFQNQLFSSDVYLAGSSNGSNDVRLRVVRSGTGANQVISTYTERYAVFEAGATPTLRFSSKNFEFWSDFEGTNWNQQFIRRLFSVNEKGQFLLSYDLFSSLSAHHSSAHFQINSTTRGFLPPRMTSQERIAITSPAIGLEVFDTTLDTKCIFTAAGWVKVVTMLA